MWAGFKDKSLKIMIIDSSMTVRNLIADSLREQGFKNISGIGSTKEAISLLEVEKVDWVLSSLQDNQEFNLIHILKLFLEESVLKKPKITALLSSDEITEYLFYLYENGLLSHIEKPFYKSTVSTALKLLASELEANNYDPTKVSAKYVMAVLQAKKDYGTLAETLANMLKIYPGDPILMANLIQVLFMDGKKEKALSVLQIFHLIGTKKESVKLLAKNLFNIDNQENLLQYKTPLENSYSVYGLDKVVIVDNDTTVRWLAVDSVKKLGVKNVFQFEDGEAAWSAIDKFEKAPELFIIEWKIPKINGPYLMQRIHYKFPLAPILIGSSLIQPTDVRLTKEMGVTEILPKPYAETQVANKVLEVLQKDRYPKRTNDLENKIRKNLDADHLTGALSLWDKYKTKDDIPHESKIKIEAELAFAQKKYEYARDLTIKAITIGEDTIILWNLLAKCYIHLDDQVSALKCLEKAKQLSPRNIQRICMIAEVHYSAGNMEKSDYALKEAKSLDPTAPRIVETDIKLAISSGKINKAKELMSKLGSISNVISYMNGRAVALARQGEISQSLELYKKTLESIPEHNLKTKATVQYNLVLALVRKDDLDKAILEIKTALNYKEDSMREKLTHLKAQLEVAQQKGLKINIDSSTNSIHSSNNDHTLVLDQYIVRTADIDAGDYCCFKILNKPELTTAKIKGLIGKKTLPFKRRDNLERSEAGNIWKTTKVT